VRVIDGDTIVVREHGRNVHLRVANVDAPELSEPGGQDAKRFVIRLCQRKKIQYDRRAIDRYHRTVATVRCGRTDLATALKQAGHIKPKRR